jgi:hypothetical protein
MIPSRRNASSIALGKNAIPITNYESLKYFVRWFTTKTGRIVADDRPSTFSAAHRRWRF